MQQKTLLGGVAKPRGPGDGAKKKVDRPMPWVEKYRPRQLAGVAHQEEVVRALQTVVSQPSPNMPHLLLYGPPGTGKTTTILALAHELFGPDYYDARVKELNASDDRGIKVVRDKVKKFCQITVAGRPYTNPDTGIRYPVPPFKILVLDEADALLHDAQTALRRMMEDFSTTTRFCFVCNYVSKIIDPIASRCAKFRFKPVSAATQKTRIEHILKSEGVIKEVSSEAASAKLDRLIGISRGDLRLAINYLQTASVLAKNQDNSLEKIHFDDLAGVVPIERTQLLYKSLFSGSFQSLQTAVHDLVLDGYSATLVVQDLAKLISDASIADLSDVQKARILLQFSEADRRIQDGADENIQLLHCASFAASIISAPSG
eukprot:NODE_1240_length_1506_cov_10.503775_g1032_i0.p1 GENE.NODE_1240_length_1506_cov_10.503775_g1032_i0~~NODE_1240_length_1506_cov_10.503775_g1032_i0.p1  ORF type:complete len:374 (-),score=87.59 NODE_1240_length_1506_cov_10.503775_g1032_i0:90-1211(-)